MRGNKLFRRRYVVPRDPRTAGQLRARSAFGAASKAWSHSLKLTQEEREAWRTAAAKIQSRPRLGQSGPLTGQMHYVGRKCAKGQLSREEKHPVRGGKRECQRATLQTPQTQRVARSTWEQRLSTTCTPPEPHACRAVRPWVRGQTKSSPSMLFRHHCFRLPVHAHVHLLRMRSSQVIACHPAVIPFHVHREAAPGAQAANRAGRPRFG
jgi:hypothetical protein